MDVETVFRGMFGIKQDKDIMHLIGTAVRVAALVDPEKLKNYRSRIIKLLFDEDPVHSTDLFSDDELSFEDDSQEVKEGFKEAAELSQDQPVKKGFEKSVGLSQIQPVKKGFKEAVEFSQDQPVKKGFEKSVDLSQIQPVNKGFEKAVELSLSQLAAPKTPSKVGKIADDNLMKYKFERTKKMLERMYHEEAEKKAKRKIQCVDFPEPKNHCGDALQRIRSRIEKMKTGHAKPKYNLHSGISVIARPISMLKMAELTEHTSRVLFMAQSPDAHFGTPHSSSSKTGAQVKSRAVR